jgi:hypothetical protein
MGSEQWDRLDDETPRAYEAANLYFSLGPCRSIARVAQELGKSETLIGRWSAKHAWVRRADAWDAQAVRLQRERDAVEQAASRRVMFDEHARLGVELRRIGIAHLRNPETRPLTISEATRLVTCGAQMEREARGIALVRSLERQLTDIAGMVIDVGLRHIPEDRHEIFLNDLEAAASAR